MCWSPEASVTLGVAGVATAVCLARKEGTKGLVAPLVYFSLMEFLQFFGYQHIDQCDLPVNQYITMLSYVHIAFQPIFFNMLYIYSRGSRIRAATKRIIYAAATVFSFLMLVKAIPLIPGTMCTIGQTLCGPVWCTVRGTWHIAWSVPLFNSPLPGDLFIYYALAVFVLPLFYGAWRGVLFALVGPVLAYATTQNPQEWPAVWCLFSVALILLGLAGDAMQERLFPDALWHARRKRAARS